MEMHKVGLGPTLVRSISWHALYRRPWVHPQHCKESKSRQLTGKTNHEGRAQKILRRRNLNDQRTSEPDVVSEEGNAH